jgi:hypothetical protein
MCASASAAGETPSARAGVHLPHCVHCCSNAHLSLDGLKVLVQQHAHAGLHRDSEPEQEVVVFAEQRVLEVNGRVGDDQETSQSCKKAFSTCCTSSHANKQ